MWFASHPVFVGHAWRSDRWSHVIVVFIVRFSWQSIYVRAQQRWTVELRWMRPLGVCEVRDESCRGTAHGLDSGKEFL